MKLTYESDTESDQTIQEVYSLSYVPSGYVLEHEMIEKTFVRYEFKNERGETLFFEQRALTRSSFVVDSEGGYSQIQDIKKHEVYYRPENLYHCYIWNDGKYSMKLTSNEDLSKEEIILLLDGITVK